MMASDTLRICTEEIDIASVYAALADPEFGAQLVFVGVVRDQNEGSKVSAVSYEAFVPLAQTILSELAQEVREIVKARLRVVIIHRLGTLKVGEISTAIGVASAHRAESYEASRFLIEQLKVRVPVWKEEHYVDGENKWLDGAQLASKDSCDNPGRGSFLQNGK